LPELLLDEQRVIARLEFDDRGTRQLKGVPGEWRLFAVAPS
jgi:hypothetical protein